MGRTANGVLIALAAVSIGLQSFVAYRFLGLSTVAGSIDGEVSPTGVQDAAEGMAVPLQGLPLRGHPDAQLVLLEFGDYQCPFCARHTAEVGPEIELAYIDRGTLRHVFVNNPLSIHPHARPMAIAAVCAGQQDRYWEMHFRLFESTPQSTSEIEVIAQSLVLDMTQFQVCADAPETALLIEEQQQIARSLGFSGTPSFAIGLMTQNGEVDVKKIIRGALPLEYFETAFADLLENVEAKVP
jgi:protein-disulfide isomerase